jgi:serine/threonine-protein kinase
MEMKVILTVEQGPEKGTSFEFDKPDCFLVGRSPQAHFRLGPEDMYVSRWHFLLMISPPSCTIQDLQSKNGTYVNGEKISETELHAGDRITIGKTMLEVAIESGESKPVRFFCAHCQKNITEEVERKRAEELKASDYLCSECQAREEIAQEAVSYAPRDFYCFKCRNKVTAYANADGRAEELVDIALYLCDNCVSKEPEKVDINAIGKYRVIKELGRGGMGVVYEAWHEPTHRLVALKKILPKITKNQKTKKLFQREMSVLQSLIHPNIVRLIDQGMIGKEYYFVSEYLPGGDVDDLLRSIYRSPLPPAKACGIICQILDGLEYAHRKGFIHRDIKPQNMLLTADSVAKLSDFGLSKNFEEAGMSGITRGGEIAGTLLFMAPEQITNYKYVKPPADIYSVGVSLYYILTGKLPFDFPSPYELLKGVLEGRKPKNPILILLEDESTPICQKRADVPSAIARVVDKSILKSEKKRFQSAKEMRDALQRAMKNV